MNVGVKENNFMNRSTCKKTLMQLRITTLKNRTILPPGNQNRKLKLKTLDHSELPHSFRTITSPQHKSKLQISKTIHDPFNKIQLKGKQEKSGHYRRLSREAIFERTNTDEQTRNRVITVTQTQLDNLKGTVQPKQVFRRSHVSLNRLHQRQKTDYNNFSQILPEDNPFTRSLPACDKVVRIVQVLMKKETSQIREVKSEMTSYIVKIYRKDKIFSNTKKERIRKEISILFRNFDHPNIVSLLAAFENKSEIHLIFQYVEKHHTLTHYFRKRREALTQSELEKQVQRIILRVCKGVHHLHSQGIIHRDLKPDNIIIGFDQDGILVKIIDFGVATDEPTTNCFCGTPNFLAPQILGIGKDKWALAADVWALGIIMFYLSQGEYPFSGRTEVQLYGKIRECRFEFKRTKSEGLRNLIHQILEINPQKRISIREVLQCAWLYG